MISFTQWTSANNTQIKNITLLVQDPLPTQYYPPTPVSTSANALQGARLGPSSVVLYYIDFPSCRELVYDGHSVDTVP